MRQFENSIGRLRIWQIALYMYISINIIIIKNNTQLPKNN